MPSPKTLWWVFLGGCVGTGLRAAVGVAFTGPTSGSWSATLGVNVLGALLLGVMAARIRRSSAPPPWLQPLVGIGLLGSFTTYSALAVDANRLARDIHPALVVAYPAISLLLGLAAVGVGLRLGRARRDTSGDASC